MTWSLAFSTLSMGHPQTGIPRDKQQWKLLHMDQNLWQQGIAVHQIVDLRYTLMYLGVPIRSKSFMLGDNKCVITSSTIPNSLLSKRHHISVYHRVREAIASKYLTLSGKMARPTQQTFSASIGSSLKSGLYLRHFYSGEERLLRSNSSQRGVIQIPLIVPPVSHREIRRILGCLLLPLSSCLVPT